ncbi:MAG: hypothetical protein GEU75_08305 [Dehalococcoidia bacterium]|nr:hypothetical protein [Dehalococcoidia bacterium]
MKMRFPLLVLLLVAGCVLVTPGMAHFGASYTAFSDTENISASAESGVWLGTIKIIKVATPSDGTDFAFTGAGGDLPASFTLDDDNDSNATHDDEVEFLLTADEGPFTISEDGPLPAGWQLAGIDCVVVGTSTYSIDGNVDDGDFDAGDDSVEIDLVAGDTVTCTFNNVRDGSITIIKDVNPEPDTTDFSFTATGAGMTPSPFSLDDDADLGLSNTRVFADLANGGSRSVTEDTETGYTVTNIVCTGDTASTVTIGAAGDFNDGDTGVTIVLADGEDITCTFTNTLDTGTIRIIKDVAGGTDPQDFSFTDNIPAPCVIDEIDDDGVGNNYIECTSVPTSSYTVAETGETGWTFTGLACVDSVTDNSSEAGSTATIVLDKDETVTCTFTNTRDTGTIRIIKDVAGGTDAQDFSFTDNIPAPCVIDEIDDDGVGNNYIECTGVPTATYTVTETGEDGWLLTNLDCVDSVTSNSSDTGSTATIVLDKDETVTCTFTNTKQTGTVIIIKDVTGSTTEPQDFTFTEAIPNCTIPTLDDDTGSNPTPPNGVTCTEVPVGGPYAVTEDALAGWSVTVNCVDTVTNNSTENNATRTGSINLESGETVTCTFTNTKVGTITIIKDVRDSEGDTTSSTSFAFTSNITGTCTPDTTPAAFSLADGGAGGGSASETCSVAPGTYTVTETLPTAGWGFVPQSCVDLTNNSAITHTTGSDTATATIVVNGTENITCTFINFIIPSACLADGFDNATVVIMPPDLLNYTGGNFLQIIVGNALNNTITGDNAKDCILGGPGNDTLNGGNGSDVLIGGSGNDTLNGGNSPDKLFGDDGDDTLDGGSSNDVICNGGTGTNTLIDCP